MLSDGVRVETIELTLRHLGLGDLDEFGLLTLFADVHAHALTEGTGHTLADIADANGEPLYPAYFRTHVVVPPTRLLRKFALWSRVDVGVAVKTFGGMLLESEYALAPTGELPADPARWDSGTRPVMHANSMFIIDDLSPQPRPSGPDDGALAELPRATRTPPAMNQVRQIRAGKLPGADLAATIAPENPTLYRLRPARDAARGHNMMFAQFTRLMELAEHEALVGGGLLSSALHACVHTLERETFYFGNCQAGETVATQVRIAVEPAPAEMTVPGHRAAGILRFALILHREGDAEDRLAIATGTRVIAVPESEGELLAEATRFCETHASPSEES